MKILIDIGHPAHVHYFRNFIESMEKNGHSVLISARDRPMVHYLLKSYKLPFRSRGKGKDGIFGKFVYMFYADFKLLRLAIPYKPDLFLSFASPYAAQTAWILRKPHIVLDDTEHAKFSHLFYAFFSQVILNPFCFYKKFGNKQIFFKSFVECFYLHPEYFGPDKRIFNILRLNTSDKFVLLRFVSWKANHDVGQSGLNNETKIAIIRLLEKKYKVFVSSESDLTDSFLSRFTLKIPPEMIHHVLYFAEFFITESGTMASEAAILNTPVIYVNSLPLMGYLREEEKIGLLFHFKDSHGVIEKTKEMMQIGNIKSQFKKRNEELLFDKINPTRFLIWFVENYPNSFFSMKSNQSSQNVFK